MASQYERPAAPEPKPGWAIGGIVFAGVVMVLIWAVTRPGALRT